MINSSSAMASLLKAPSFLSPLNQKVILEFMMFRNLILGAFLFCLQDVKFGVHWSSQGVVQPHGALFQIGKSMISNSAHVGPC